MSLSVIVITLNRSALTPQIVEQSLSRIGCPYELIIADNGSTEGEVRDWAASRANKFFDNKDNIGVAAALNQMSAAAEGEYICHLANDIEMPESWGEKMLKAHKVIPSTGVCAIHTVELCPPVSHIGTFPVRLNKIVFGPKCVRKALMGYEEFSKYGFEDSALCLRLYYAGYYNYYLADCTAKHIGVKSEDTGDYRKMKWHELAKAEKGFGQALARYKALDLSKY